MASELDGDLIPVEGRKAALMSSHVMNESEARGEYRPLPIVAWHLIPLQMDSHMSGVLIDAVGLVVSIFWGLWEVVHFKQF